MKRWLCISFSALCGVASLLLCLLWIRSHYLADILYVYGFTSLRLDGLTAFSSDGVLALYLRQSQAPKCAWLLHSMPVEKAGVPPAPFSFFYQGLEYGFSVSHWFVAQAVAVLAVAPWFSWRRFSIKRLLVVSTYLAALCTLIILSRR